MTVTNEKKCIQEYMKLIIYFLFIITCVSCTTEAPIEEAKSVNSDVIDTQEKTNSDEIPIVDTKSNSRINFTDSLGRKQGKWEKYYNNKIAKKEFYKDGKLEGKCYEYWANGEILESTYKNGIRQGYFMHYEPNTSSAKFLTFWKDNQKLWSTFPIMIETDFVPVKGFINSTNKEIEIVVPYISGKTLSIGTINEEGRPIGKQRIYYKTQEPKTLIDYDVDSIKIYSKTGKLLEKRKLKGAELINTANTQ